MTTMIKSVGNYTVAAETERGGSTYYKSLVQSGYAPVNGLQMYYEIHGTGRPLVSIHPFAGLANVFPQLTRNRQLIAMELQAHGRTADIADRPLTFEQHADDIAALLRHLEIPQADFFGESFGGIVAVQMAVRYPSLVRRVAIYGSALGRLQDVTRPESMEGLMSLTADHYSVQFQREGYQSVAPDPEQWPTLFTKATRIAWNGFTTEQLESIGAPLLIAAGDQDILGPRLEHLLEVSRIIPRAQLAVVPDAGHFVLNENPEKLLPIITAFLDEPLSKVPFATTTTGYHPGVTR